MTEARVTIEDRLPWASLPGPPVGGGQTGRTMLDYAAARRAYR